ncbi:hypothetical protein GCM10009524_26420 [Spirilliplanes yamanashiensis]
MLLLLGAAWMIAAWSVPRFEPDAADQAAWLTGALLIFAAGAELARASLAPTWRQLHGGLAILSALVGMIAVGNPAGTVVGLAALVGFFLLVRGGVDIAVAAATRQSEPAWGAQLAIGAGEAVVGFWAAARFVETTSMLVVTLGAFALLRGIAEIVAALRMREAKPQPRAAGYAAGQADFVAAGRPVARHRADESVREPAAQPAAEPVGVGASAPGYTGGGPAVGSAPPPTPAGPGGGSTGTTYRAGGYGAPPPPPPPSSEEPGDAGLDLVDETGEDRPFDPRAAAPYDTTPPDDDYIGRRRSAGTLASDLGGVLDPAAEGPGWPANPGYAGRTTTGGTDTNPGWPAATAGEAVSDRAEPRDGDPLAVFRPAAPAGPAVGWASLQADPADRLTGPATDVPTGPDADLATHLGADVPTDSAPDLPTGPPSGLLTEPGLATKPDLSTGPGLPAGSASGLSTGRDADLPTGSGFIPRTGSAAEATIVPDEPTGLAADLPAGSATGLPAWSSPVWEPSAAPTADRNLDPAADHMANSAAGNTTGHVAGPAGSHAAGPAVGLGADRLTGSAFGPAADRGPAPAAEPAFEPATGLLRPAAQDEPAQEPAGGPAGIPSGPTASWETPEGAADRPGDEPGPARPWFGIGTATGEATGTALPGPWSSPGHVEDRAAGEAGPSSFSVADRLDRPWAAAAGEEPASRDDDPLADVFGGPEPTGTMIKLPSLTGVDDDEEPAWGRPVWQAAPGGPEEPVGPQGFSAAWQEQQGGVSWQAADLTPERPGAAPGYEGAAVWSGSPHGPALGVPEEGPAGLGEPSGLPPVPGGTFRAPGAAAGAEPAAKPAPMVARPVGEAAGASQPSGLPPLGGGPRVGVPQVGVPQVGVPQVGVPQVGVPQVGVPQVGVPQIGEPQDAGPGARPGGLPPLYPPVGGAPIRAGMRIPAGQAPSPTPVGPADPRAAAPVAPSGQPVGRRVPGDPVVHGTPDGGEDDEPREGRGGWFRNGRRRRSE